MPLVNTHTLIPSSHPFCPSFASSRQSKDSLQKQNQQFSLIFPLTERSLNCSNPPISAINESKSFYHYTRQKNSLLQNINHNMSMIQSHPIHNVNICINQPEAQHSRERQRQRQRRRQRQPHQQSISLLCETLRRQQEQHKEEIKKMEIQHEEEIRDLIRLYNLQREKCKQLMEILEQEEYCKSEEQSEKYVIQEQIVRNGINNDKFKESFSFGANALHKDTL